MLLPSFVLIGLLSGAARADTPKDQLCLAGAQASLDLVLFSTDATDILTNQCTSRLRLTSLYVTAHEYCTERDISAWYEAKNKECEEGLGVSLMPYSDVAKSFTEDYIQGLKVIHNMAEGATSLLEKPVLLSEEYFTQGYKTLESWDIATAAHDFHSFMPYVFWAAIVFFGIVHRACNTFLLSQQYEVDQDIEGRQSTNASMSLPVRITSKIHRWINTHLLLPSEFGSGRRKLGWMWHRQISTRIQTIVVVLYCILIILLCATDYYTYYESIYFDTKSHQIQRHVADRMGIMAIGSLPILWAFSGRNNIIFWVTGWRFGTLNLYHRTIARITMVLAIIHASAYTRYYIELEYYKISLVEPWLRCGVLAITTISVMVGFSSSIVRQKIYDLWLLLHVILAVVVVVALFYHTSVLEGKYNPFIWSIVAIWGFERAVRLLRLAYCNLPFSSTSGKRHSTKSTAVYLKEANVIKVEVFPGSGSLYPRPGQHYFLYEPFRLKGYEHHVFSLASWSNSDTTTKSPDVDPSEPSEKTQIGANLSSNPSSDGSAPPVQQSEKEVTGRGDYNFSFYIRPLSGWTSRLKNQCLKSESPIDLTLLVEGPYGGPSPLYKFEHVVLIAGGSGITATLPYIRDHFTRSSSGDKLLRTRSVNLIWTAKEKEFINYIFSTELSGLIQGSESFTAECFATSSTPTPAPAQSGPESSDTENENTSSHQTKINTGRPDIPTLIRQKIENIAAVDSQGGRTAVFASGPAALADSTRATVHKLLKETSYELEYFEEVFGW